MDLGDRMKVYEQVSESYLLRRIPVCIRLDGNCFHSWTRGLKRPYDDDLRKCMEYAAYRTCKEISGARFAYTQSDEISIILVDYQDISTEPWFNYRTNKVQSVAAALCTSFFAEASLMWLRDHTKKKGFPAFDARAFNLPKEEVANYVHWRQEDCSRNSLTALAQSYFSDKELHGKNASEKQDMLMLQKSVNWNDVETRYKRGVSFYKVCRMAECRKKDGTIVSDQKVERSVWVKDYEMPRITQDRAYVEKWLEPVVELDKPFETNTSTHLIPCEDLDLSTILQ